MSVKVNDQVPAFIADDPYGNPVSSENLEGFPTLILFFPKDMSPSFSTLIEYIVINLDRFNDFDARVIAVVPLSLQAAQVLEAKYPFTLISDPQSKLFKLFGVNQESGILLDQEAVVRFIETPLKAIEGVDRLNRSLIKICSNL